MGTRRLVTAEEMRLEEEDESAEPFAKFGQK